MELLNLEEELSTLLQQAKQTIQEANDLPSIEQLRVRYLGKKSQLTDLLKNLSQLSAEERPKLGKVVNNIKEQLNSLLSQKEKELQEIALKSKLSAESLDFTLPGRGEKIGGLHPVSRVRERVIKIFSSQGFSVEEGPEIEDDYHNFQALNIPEHHPARASQATFYFPNGHLLRTHTSTVQIRVMEKQQPPIRTIAVGRVYRRDMDPTHTPMFHQLEGLVVDKHCTFSSLKGVLHDFLNQFFEADLKLRFRPSYFPFTEPSAEVDIRHCDQTQCRVCKGSGWLEVLGCGMVHPNVLRNVGINHEEYTGFAFGIGLDRLAMLRYGIDDLRILFENDLRFLNQFIG